MNSILRQAEALTPYLPFEFLENFIQPLVEVDYDWVATSKESYHDNCHPTDVLHDWQTYSKFTKWFLNNEHKITERKPLAFLIFQSFQIAFSLMRYRPSSWPLDAYRGEERYTTTAPNPMSEAWVQISNRYRPTSKFFREHSKNPRFIPVMKAQFNLLDDFLHDLKVLPKGVHLDISSWYPHRLPDGRLIYIPKAFEGMGVEEFLNHDRAIALVALEGYHELDDDAKRRFLEVVAKSAAHNKLKAELGLFKKYDK